MTLNDSRKVTVSRQSFDFDGYPCVYGVHDRETQCLLGHVGTRDGRHWSYLRCTDPRGAWTVAGRTRADAVDHLQSADNPVPWRTPQRTVAEGCQP